jgi:hypothetical protein
LTNKFKIGDRVRMTSRTYDRIAYGQRGEVMEDSSNPYVAWDGLTDGHDGLMHDGSTNQWAVDQEHLEKLVPASTYLNGHEDDMIFTIPAQASYFDLLKKQERFLTAWKDGPEFSLTGDNYFNTQRDADNHANAIAAAEADVTVVVLKVVSSHSSRVVVSTEAL